MLSHIASFFFVVSTFKIYFLHKTKVYNAVLLTITTMPYIRLSRTYSSYKSEFVPNGQTLPISHSPQLLDTSIHCSEF